MKTAALKIAICVLIGAIGGAVLVRAYLAQADAPARRTLDELLATP